MSIEAMKLALVALELARSSHVQILLSNPPQSAWTYHNVDWTILSAVKNLRQAITEAENQEPVAWMFQHEETGRTMCVDAQQVEWGFEKGNPRLKKVAPLYTSPQPQKPWVGLTDDEIEIIYASCSVWDKFEYERMLEAKLKEKNNGL